MFQKLLGLVGQEQSVLLAGVRPCGCNQDVLHDVLGRVGREWRGLSLAGPELFQLSQHGIRRWLT